jgi:hypothetical protein
MGDNEAPCTKGAAMFEIHLIDIAIKIALEQLFEESWLLAIVVVALVVIRLRFTRQKDDPH